MKAASVAPCICHGALYSRNSTFWSSSTVLCIGVVFSARLVVFADYATGESLLLLYCGEAMAVQIETPHTQTKQTDGEPDDKKAHCRYLFINTC